MIRRTQISREATPEAGRKYFVYCESRNVNHYDVKVTEVP